MTTFLQLCIDTARDSGAVGKAPTSVLDQTGRQEKVVNWVRDAWKLIQTSQENWIFLRANWIGTLIPGAMEYSAVSFSVPRFGHWLTDMPNYRPTTIYDPAIGKKDEHHIGLISYEQWKVYYDRGYHDPSRPQHYALAPNGELRFGQTPDKPYTVRGEYKKTAQILDGNADTPDFPEMYHDIIKWRAIMLMAEHDESPPGLQMAFGKYRELLFQLQRTQLPTFNVGAEPPIDAR